VVTIPISITTFEILLGLTLVAVLVTGRRFRLPPIWIPLALFACGTFISLAASGHIREGLPQVRKMYIYLMLFLVTTVFEKARQIRWMVLGWSIAAALSAAWGVKQFVEKYRHALVTHQPFYNYYVDRRITGFTDHWMTLGGEMMIVLLLIAAVVLFSADRRWLGLCAAAVPVGAALQETWTRSMWLGAFCGGVYLLWFWRRWAVLAVPPSIALLLWVNPFEFRERALSSFSPNDKTDSNTHRAELRGIGLEMIKAHPWLGVGPEQVSRQYRNYLPSDMLPHPGEYYGHLENDYIQYAAERGVPTMLALMWAIAWAMRDFLRALRRLPTTADERWVLHGAVAVTIGILVSGWYSWNLNNSSVLAMFLAVTGSGYAVVNQAFSDQNLRNNRLAGQRPTPQGL
jgi:putative inorganic carbon (HCO3(-)) transporter